MVSLADLLRRHWPEYLRQFGERILPSHRRAVRAILACRTAALGGKSIGVSTVRRIILSITPVTTGRVPNAVIRPRPSG